MRAAKTSSGLAALARRIVISSFHRGIPGGGCDAGPLERAVGRLLVPYVYTRVMETHDLELETTCESTNITIAKETLGY